MAVAFQAHPQTLGCTLVRWCQHGERERLPRHNLQVSTVLFSQLLQRLIGGLAGTEKGAGQQRPHGSPDAGPRAWAGKRFAHQKS
ncbi:hypothetical protein D3C76_1661910 [compost metagenome]